MSFSLQKTTVSWEEYHLHALQHPFKRGQQLPPLLTVVALVLLQPRQQLPQLTLGRNGGVCWVFGLQYQPPPHVSRQQLAHRIPRKPGECGAVPLDGVKLAGRWYEHGGGMVVYGGVPLGALRWQQGGMNVMAVWWCSLGGITLAAR